MAAKYYKVHDHLARRRVVVNDSVGRVVLSADTPQAELRLLAAANRNYVYVEGQPDRGSIMTEVSAPVKVVKKATRKSKR